MYLTVTYWRKKKILYYSSIKPIFACFVFICLYEVYEFVLCKWKNENCVSQSLRQASVAPYKNPS